MDPVNASKAASIIASDNVGCAWIVNANSSHVDSSALASPNSAMSSVASEPTICAPNSSPYFLSKISFTNPTVSVSQSVATFWFVGLT